MRKVHIAIVAGLLAAAAVLGALAATRTVSLGAKQAGASDAAITARTKQLDRFEASLRRTLEKAPPPLPAVPTTAAARPVAAPAAPAVRVVYRRPPAVVVTRPARDGNDDHAQEQGHDESHDRNAEHGGGDD